MQCPRCTTELKVTQRQGVEVDHCPQCRGIWLDRGELDKLLERESAPVLAEEERAQSRSDPTRAERWSDDNRDWDTDRRQQQPRRKNWLSELFDGD